MPTPEARSYEADDHNPARSSNNILPKPVDRPKFLPNSQQVLKLEHLTAATSISEGHQTPPRRIRKTAGPRPGYV